MKSYNVISFDIFDTLVVRNCGTFNNLWKIIEKEADNYFKYKTIFYENRKNAELECYKDGNMTPSIEEIYQKTKYSQNEKNYLLYLEQKIELDMCVANFEIKKVFDKYKTENKKIYAISDMYYSSDFLLKLLKKCGYEVDGIIVSNEEGYSKKGGKLFEVLIKKYSINKNDLLHYGDSQVSDIDGSHIVQIASQKVVPINHMVYLQKKHSKTVIDELVYGYTKNNISFLEARLAQIGFETLGPVILGYCQWLHKRKKELGIKNILFCSRDLKQTYQWYIKLYPKEKDECIYFYVSLKSLSAPYRVAKGDTSNENDNMQYDLLRKYITQIVDGYDFILADSGFGGHTQLMLSRVLGDEYRIHGLYMRITQKFNKKARINNSAEAYLFSDNPSPQARISGGFFESVIQASHGRTVGYMEDSQGLVHPIFAEQKECVKTVDEIQSGIDYFINGWIQRGYHKYKINPSFIENSFLRLTFYPEIEDVKLLSTLQGGNNVAVSMIEKNHDENIFHPVTLMKGLQKNYWKGGYLSEVFRSYKWISHIYICLDSLYLMIRGF
ncbi:MAG: hypothetical protein K6E10_08110 [Eubacterium sp.]|nr:hypothetical protein [Eubacterium sp.]